MEKRCENCFEIYDSEYEMCPACGYFEGFASDEINQLPLGTTLNNRYIVGKVLGFGGFGITYKVWDMKLSTICAIKEFFPSSFVNRNPNTNEIIIFSEKRKTEFEFGLSRFLDEAQNMAKFNTHGNIVNVYEYFEENKTAYIVMEFLDGSPLNLYMQNEEISVSEGIDIVLNVCAALKDIHKIGIVHRDISPDNIFICKDGKIKLIDFGAARFSSAEEQQRTIILKPGFAPPEQYESVSVQGAWTDIYALGATLYYLITKTKPEESTNRRIKDELVSPHILNPEVPENVSNAVMKAMALDRHLRFNSVEDFELAINNKKKVVPLKLEIKKRKTKRILGILTGVLIVAVIGTAFTVGFKKEKDENTLPQANIELWYIIDNEHESEQKRAIELIAADFCDTYNTVTITAVGYGKDNYLQKLNEAVEAGKPPAIFESCDGSKTRTADLKETMASAAAKYDCLFLKDYIKKCDTAKAPLGFGCAMIFQNTKLMNETISKWDEATLKAHFSGDLAVTKEMADAFSKEYPEFANVGISDADNLFIDEKVPVLFTQSSMFFRINQKLAGKYIMNLPALKDTFCFSRDMVSVSLLTEDEITVSKAFVEYLYCAKYQEIYHVEGATGAFPMNKNAWNSFVDVYPTFSELKNRIEDGTLYEF